MCSLKHSLKHYQFFFNFEFALDYLRLKKQLVIYKKPFILKFNKVYKSEYFLSLLLVFTCCRTSFFRTKTFDEFVELVELVDELLEDELVFLEELLFE